MIKKNSLFFIIILLIFYSLLFIYENKNVHKLAPLHYNKRVIPVPDNTFYAGLILGTHKRFLQQHEASCGPASLRYLLSTSEIHVSEKELLNKINISGKGSSFLSLVEVASDYGVKLKGVRTDLESLSSVPAVIHINNSHFVVYLRHSEHDKNVYIFDPEYGYVLIFYKDFKKIWKGYALINENQLDKIN
ncbi:MAG: cysteine peptidase family C39 domain-containing protein [Candidatus Muiribacteriota bacterium]